MLLYLDRVVIGDLSDLETLSRLLKKVRKQAIWLSWEIICQGVRNSCQASEEEVWCVLEIEKNVCLV